MLRTQDRSFRLCVLFLNGYISCDYTTTVRTRILRFMSERFRFSLFEDCFQHRSDIKQPFYRQSVIKQNLRDTKHTNSCHEDLENVSQLKGVDDDLPHDQHRGYGLDSCAENKTEERADRCLQSLRFCLLGPQELSKESTKE